MKFLCENIPFLESLTFDERRIVLLEHYHTVPTNIVEYTLLKHFAAMQMIEEFLDIDLNNSRINLERFSSEQLFNSVDYANFCTYRNESQEYYINSMKNNLELPYIKDGSWLAPIVLVKRGNMFFTLDGNNRLRMLRCYIKWSNHEVQRYHLAYVIEKQLPFSKLK